MEDPVFGFPSSRIPSGVPAPDRTRDLVLYQYNSCPYCRRVLSKIDELGLVGQVTLRDTLRDPGAREALRAATGTTQVPCLFVDGEPLLESADINAWLGAYAARETS